MIDVSPHQLKIIRKSLNKYVPECEVRVFGSRATWTAKDYSDLDLVIVGEKKLSGDIIFSLKEAFQESDLPFRVDVLDWNAISKEFRKVMEKHYEVIFPASEGKFKETEIGRIPEGWSIVLLHTLSKKITKGTTPTTLKKKFIKSGINFIKVESIGEDGFFDKGKFMFIDNETDELLKRSKFEENDILYTIAGTIGRVAVVSRDILPANTNQAVAIIRPKEKTNIKFLRYSLINPKLKNHLISKTVHAVQANLSLTELGNAPVMFPPVPEQKAIAKILSDLDTKIELNHQMNKTLEQIAQVIFKQWFVDVDKAGKCRVSDLVEFDPRIAVKKGDVLAYVDMGALPTEGMNISDVVRKAFAGGARFQSKDTLLARITPCLENGKTGFVNFLADDSKIAFGSTEFIVMRPKTGIAPSFVYCLARDLRFRECAIQSMVGSSGRQRVQVDMLSAFGIWNPNKDLMSKFDAVTKPLFRQIKKNREESIVLSKTRDSLLPRLMSGKIRVRMNR